MPATLQVPSTVGEQSCMCELEVAVTLRHEKGKITLFGQRNVKGTVHGNENCKTFGIQLKYTAVDFI